LVRSYSEQAQLHTVQYSFRRYRTASDSRSQLQTVQYSLDYIQNSFHSRRVHLLLLDIGKKSNERSSYFDESSVVLICLLLNEMTCLNVQRRRFFCLIMTFLRAWEDSHSTNRVLKNRVRSMFPVSEKKIGPKTTVTNVAALIDAKTFAETTLA